MKPMKHAGPPQGFLGPERSRCRFSGITDTACPLRVLGGSAPRSGVFGSAPWLLALVLLSGCAQDEFADLRDFLAQAGQGVQQKLDPLPPVMAKEEFAYDPGELPDPFRQRSMKTGKGGGIQPDLTRPKGPLEQDPLDGLRMVGTLIKGGQLFALIRRPDGTLYRVSKGEHIGQNFGVILSISESSIEIKEIVQDGTGDWTESKANMALQE